VEERNGSEKANIGMELAQQQHMSRGIQASKEKNRSVPSTSTCVEPADGGTQLSHKLLNVLQLDACTSRHRRRSIHCSAHRVSSPSTCFFDRWTKCGRTFGWRGLDRQLLKHARRGTQLLVQRTANPHRNEKMSFHIVACCCSDLYLMVVATAGDCAMIGGFELSTADGRQPITSVSSPSNW
jgi:hypothetical protein